MRRVAMMVAAGAAMGLAGVAMGQGVDFGSATVVNGAATVNGSLSAGVTTEIMNENFTVDAGSIYQRRVSMGEHGLSTGTAFTLYTGPGYDTEMRLLDAGLVQISQNDDGGPFGTSPNWGSQLTGNVNADGSINFDISYFTDDSFTGASTGGSSYWSLNVVSGAVNGQWWAFTGLTPGSNFSAETIAASFTNAQFYPDDTVVAGWDSSGALIGYNDDGGGGQGLSLLEGVVPADGIVYISVASYHGGGLGTQDYYTAGNVVDGTFTLQFIPTPGSLALLGLGGLVAVRRRR